MIIDGVELNPETNANDLREIPFRFPGATLAGMELVVRAPNYIARHFTASVRDQIAEEIAVAGDVKFEEIVGILGTRERALAAIKTWAQEFAAQRVYDVFTKSQIKAGNQAWAVPETLQRTIKFRKGQQ